MFLISKIPDHKLGGPDGRNLTLGWISFGEMVNRLSVSIITIGSGAVSISVNMLIRIESIKQETKNLMLQTFFLNQCQRLKPGPYARHVFIWS